MTICKLSGLACDCQPDEGVPCSMEGDGLRKCMLGWRAEAIRLAAEIATLRASQAHVSTTPERLLDRLVSAARDAEWHDFDVAEYELRTALSQSQQPAPAEPTFEEYHNAEKRAAAAVQPPVVPLTERQIMTAYRSFVAGNPFSAVFEAFIAGARFAERVRGIGTVPPSANPDSNADSVHQAGRSGGGVRTDAGGQSGGEASGDGLVQRT